MIKTGTNFSFFKNKGRLVLSENALLRYFTFTSLYTAQGIPEGLTFFAIPAWLAMNGKSVAEIGSFNKNEYKKTYSQRGDSRKSSINSEK